MKKQNKAIKVRKSLAKRFRVTKTGKVMRRGAQNRHLKSNRSNRNRRRSNVPHTIKNKMAKKIKAMLAK